MTAEQYTAITNTLAEIIRGTEWEGHVYAVGGCVRDKIMKHEIHDIDLAVTTPNGGILFSLWLWKHKLTARGRKPLTFEHFGTAKFRLRAYTLFEIDCVQTRKGRYVYEEEPKPLENFGTIEEDCMCRDLTINSLLINISTGELLDPTGRGLEDIHAHIIRTPNDPDISLRDNAMHILRCIRFAVKYGWALSPELMEAMKRNVDIVGEATTKRMVKELLSIMRLQDRDKAFEIIKEVGAWEYVEPYITLAKQAREEKRAMRRNKYQLSKNGGSTNGKGNPDKTGRGKTSTAKAKAISKSKRRRDQRRRAKERKEARARAHAMTTSTT